MFLEEKLDLLKKELSPEHLVIRYNEFKIILDKIEKQFLSFGDFNSRHCDWKSRLKDFRESTLDKAIFDLIDEKLGEGQKYWWVFVEQPDHPSSRHLIFDATITGGKRLSYLFPDSPIFIIEKKYQWMMVIDKDNQIFKERRLSNR